MIVVTGAAGFIGSNIVSELIRTGYKDIVVVDLDGKIEACKYLVNKEVKHVLFDDLENFIMLNNTLIQSVIHMGACSDTTESDPAIFEKYNLGYSKMLWHQCTTFGIPYIYASSAATYGDGDNGYSDVHDLIPKLEPLNLYGFSKQNFDLWALDQDKYPPFWAGLKFFNVYGPNEDHKGRMASVVRHAFYQIKAKGEMKLFRSHSPDYNNGEQIRDFVYVKDITSVIQHLMEQRPQSGIFNVGTGSGRSFNDLVKYTFLAMGVTPNISYIDTPIDIRDKYQYYTCADISKLNTIGYPKSISTIEEGVTDYVQNYLMKDNHN